jgi:hypothetical protein
MYERLKEKEAELAFNATKGRILNEPSRIKFIKNRPVLRETENGKCAYDASRYSPLEEIEKHLRPLLVEENMDPPIQMNRVPVAES